MKVSLIICAHNPRPEFLIRTLEGLKRQTLPLDTWEFILVDNASKEPLAGRFDLSWHPNARIVLEEQLGLTPARLRGFREAKGEIFCMVDDDNVLAPDYLEQGLQVFQTFPQMGAIGGHIDGEFESEPEPDVLPFTGRLALCSLEQPRWGNVYEPWVSPCGAGMMVRRVVAQEFMKQLENSELRRGLGRKGASLASSEDIDLGFCACDLGYGMGRFPQLRMTHLIPSGRVQKDYMLRLMEKGSETEELLLMVRGLAQPSKGRELRYLLEEWTSGILLKGFTAQARRKIARGHRRGLRRFRTLTRSAQV